MKDQKLVKTDYLGVPKCGVCFGKKLPFNFTVQHHPDLNILSVSIVWVGVK